MKFQETDGAAQKLFRRWFDVCPALAFPVNTGLSITGDQPPPL